MKYPTIRIEGSILNADILDKIEREELLGQKPKDFWMKGSEKVKDEIVKAWADAQDMWRIYQRKIESIPETKTGTSETRNFWLVPLLSLLDYEIELYRKAQIVNGKSYAISHHAANLGSFPIHIMGCNDNMDKKRRDSGPRMSPHALVQEYINLTEHLYALVSNGLTIRLLRDSSRLIKLSFLEFDLERMFKEDHFTDFALMYRLLHASRMPQKKEEGAESLIEGYHQDSLESGSRIREGLSDTVEYSLEYIANGFLSHVTNDELRAQIKNNQLGEKEFYRYLLTFIYRLLFLMVIEERDLIFEKDTPQKIRDIYYQYYSINRIRSLSEKRYLADAKHSDLWCNLKNTFRLFENRHYGEKLNIQPLDGDLFSSDAIGILNKCDLNNEVLLNCLRNLSVFTNPNTGQKMRVNYGSLNVEEFGSVYEGLLEYDPKLSIVGNKITFSFIKGTERSTSGTHFTPDELVQPLIKHSLDYVIEEKMKKPEPEQALLSITVCDVACGSGHILLNAARRIANQLAKVRTGEDQPSPSAFRRAVRNVIQHCIYGVDKNPLAVELAKVALWLEAHNPGEPLNFLDHHIKCGDAIVGLAHKKELQKGIPNQAFKNLPGDDTGICRELRDKNKIERKYAKKIKEHYEVIVNHDINNITNTFRQLDQMPEHTPAQIEAKHKKYEELTSGSNYWHLKLLADIRTAQFFISKTKENEHKIITDAKFRSYLRGEQMIGEAVGQAEAEAVKRCFFHWFLEFPEVFKEGGFDCILGNPPFLGGKKISTNYGLDYVNWIKFKYPTIGSSDIVGYFFRRIFVLIKRNGFQSLIATNTIAQGDTRKVGLERILQKGGHIDFALRSVRWPGEANVEVSLVGVFKGDWNNQLVLDNREVNQITSYLDDSINLGDPYKLKQNYNKSFQGTIVLGKGFILRPDEAKSLIDKNPNNNDVLFPYLNGRDLNNSIDQSPSRWVINFFDWEEDYCRKNYPDCWKILKERVKPQRDEIVAKGNQIHEYCFWKYWDRRSALYQTIEPLDRVMVSCRVSKYVNQSLIKKGLVYDVATTVVARDDYFSYSILNTSFHKHWAWKYASTMKGDIRYINKACIDTFPYPKNPNPKTEAKLRHVGKQYHEFRRDLLQKLQLGLTKTYNQFHNPNLTKDEEILQTSELEKLNKNLSRKKLKKRLGKDTYYLWNHIQKTKEACSLEEAVQGVTKLRSLHREMDEAVLEAYGWHEQSEAGPAITLEHDFYEVDYLPEKDRVRYTISPAARKEVLKRLLLLNHKIYEKEVMQGLHGKKAKKKFLSDSSSEKKKKQKAPEKKRKKENKEQVEFFQGNEDRTPEDLKGKMLKSFRIGQRVRHDIFGEGVVKNVEGSGENAKVVVDFGNETKKLMAKMAGLRGA